MGKSTWYHPLLEGLYVFTVSSVWKGKMKNIPYLSLLAQLVTIFVYGPVVHFLYMDWPGTCIILDKKYNIANSSCHFRSYGSIWTGPSPKKYYMDLRSFGPYNIFLVTDWSIYCHMTLSAMNYLLYVCSIMKPSSFVASIVCSWKQGSDCTQC
jgi:hypothetical protein